MSTSTTDSVRNDTHTLQRVSIIAFATITAAYVIVLARFDSFPFQDFPNHLTRSAIIADLLFHHGATFGQLFDFRFMPVPYILGDVLLAALVELFGPTGAGVLWNTLVLLSWPAALLFLTYVTGMTRNARLLVLFVSLYLATDWFFLLAFTQFRLGMALMVAALAVAHLLRLRWTAAHFAWFCVIVLAGYFTHLAFVIFLAPSLIVSAAVRLYFRQTSVRTELWLIAPVIAVMLWHFGFADHAYRSAGPAPYGWRWGELGLKLQGLQSEFLRFGSRSSKLLMLGFLVVVGWGLWRDLRWKTLLKPRVVEMLALAFTFFCIYIMLPSQYSQAAYVDVRALALISLFLILARVSLSENTPAIVLALAAILAACNLAYLSVHLTGDDAWMKGYRQIVARVPKGTTVLPIYASGTQGGISPLLHTDSYIVMERAALEPFLFSGDAGHPMKYFSYKHRLYRPYARWYDKGWPVDWRAIACNYQFLLVDKPYDPRRIEIQTSTVAENGSAALLKVNGGCTYSRSEDAASATPSTAEMPPAAGNSFLRARK